MLCWVAFALLHPPLCRLQLQPLLLYPPHRQQSLRLRRLPRRPWQQADGIGKSRFAAALVLDSATLLSLRTWTERRETLIGTTEKRDSLSYIERQIKDLEGLPERLKEVEESRGAKVQEIFAQIQEIVLTYRKLYHPVQEFILLNPVANQKLHLEFDASIVPVNLDETLLGKVNQGRRGSFAGVEDGKRALKAIVDTADFQTDVGAWRSRRRYSDGCARTIDSTQRLLWS